jgi:ABC-2 type transport system ATP-binding protein
VAIVEIQHLSKHFKILNRHEGLLGAIRDLFSNDYRIVKAVDDISFTIEPGEIVGYIGPNGAGKSTTIKMMTGILKPDYGEISVTGNVPFQNRTKNAQNIGVVFGQRSQLWWDLPVIESFKLLKEIYRVDRHQFDRQMSRFNSLTDLKTLYPQTVRSLSLGQRMLCDMMAAFLHNPKIVFLDEPTIGLDVAIKARIRDLIKELNRIHTTTIILTTHDISDVEALCNRIIIIDKGHIIYDGDIQRVNRLFGAYRTLKIQHQSVDEKPNTEMITSDLVREFGERNDISVKGGEGGWSTISFRQDEIPLLKLLHYTLSHYQIRDVQIVELAMESVVKRIYEGALQ